MSTSHLKLRSIPLTFILAGVGAMLACGQPSAPGAKNGPRFAVSFPADLAAGPLDGRVLLMISSDPGSEPRFQISDGAASQLVFGIDVDGWKPGEKAAIDASVLGYPLDSLGDLPAGTYQVQALIHRYETFKRADGHTVKLPMDRGEGQKWNRAPGDLYSTPKSVTLDPKAAGEIDIVLDKVIAFHGPGMR